MYTSEQYQALSPENFDFSNFDFMKAKADFKAYVEWARGKKGGPPPTYGIRKLHVTRCLYRGTPMERIETVNTREPLQPYQIKYTIEAYEIENEEA